VARGYFDLVSLPKFPFDGSCSSSLLWYPDTLLGSWLVGTWLVWFLYNAKVPFHSLHGLWLVWCLIDASSTSPVLPPTRTKYPSASIVRSASWLVHSNHLHARVPILLHTSHAYITIYYSLYMAVSLIVHSVLLVYT
jgi:hypothetical protein